MSRLRALILSLIAVAAKAQTPAPSAAELLAMPAPTGEFYLVTPPSWSPLSTPTLRPPAPPPVDTRRIRAQVLRQRRLEGYEWVLHLAVDVLNSARLY